MLFTAIRDVLNALRQFTDQALKFALAATVLYAFIMLTTFVVRAVKNKRPYSLGYVLVKTCLFALFGIYCSYLISLTLSGREPGSRSGFANFIPFSCISFENGVPITVMENFILFVPFGFFMPCVWKYFRGFWRILLCGFSASLAIESAQLLTGRGYFDVDDIILNTLGAIIGYVIFSALYDGFLGIKRRIHVEVAKENKRTPILGNLYNRFALQHSVVLFAVQSFFVFVWINIIMGFSSETGEESGLLSKTLLFRSMSFFGGTGGKSMSEIVGSESFLQYEKILRKSAHMFEYAVLALLVWAVIYTVIKIPWVLSYCTAVAAVFIVAICDEKNQSIMSGRYGSMTDVWVDLIGAGLMIIGIMMVVSLTKTRYHQRYYN